MSASIRPSGSRRVERRPPSVSIVAPGASRVATHLVALPQVADCPPSGLWITMRTAAPAAVGGCRRIS